MVVRKMGTTSPVPPLSPQTPSAICAHLALCPMQPWGVPAAAPRLGALLKVMGGGGAWGALWGLCRALWGRLCCVPPWDPNGCPKMGAQPAPQHQTWRRHQGTREREEPNDS